MNSKDISIIVPVYNAQKYVEETIKSLINQTFTNIEIILVNDGSSDNSKQICEEYAKKDKRIVVINKENGGLADARNAGMKAATGRYIMFLDADDLFEKDSCENMYNLIERTNADYVIGNYQMTTEDGKKYETPAFNTDKFNEFKLDKNDFTKSFFVMNSTAWNKIYRTKFLNDNGITFKLPSPEEDNYFTSLCYIKAKTGYYMPKVMYLYRNCPNSLSKDCSLKYFKAINKSYRTIYQTFVQNEELNYYRYVYAKKNAYLLCQLIDSNQITDDEKIEFLKEFEWYFKLGDDLKINVAHESIRKLISLVKQKDYSNAIIEMNKLKSYRKDIPINIRNRMSFPTVEDYIEMGKYDNEYKK